MNITWPMHQYLDVVGKYRSRTNSIRDTKIDKNADASDSLQEAERNCLSYTRLHLMKFENYPAFREKRFDLLFHCTGGKMNVHFLFKSFHTFPPYLSIRSRSFKQFKLIATLVLRESLTNETEVPHYRHRW